VLKVRVGNAEEVTTLLIPSDFPLEQRFDNAVGALSLHLAEGVNPSWVDTEDVSLRQKLERHYGLSLESDVPWRQGDSSSHSLDTGAALQRQVDDDLGALAV
jgi:hypothetical protein